MKLKKILDMFRGKKSKPTFDFSDIPGAFDGMCYYINYTEFQMFANYYEFNENYLKVFEQIHNEAEQYKIADLKPYVIWNIYRGALYVTSEERLRGIFIQ